MTENHSRVERGAAAVEFAILLPVLIAVVLGIAEFGHAFFVQGSIAGAAREGVRNYAIHYSSVGAESTAANIARAATPDPTKVTSVTFSPKCAAGVETTATVSYSYSTLTGWFDSIVGANLNLTGRGTMRCGG